MDMALVECQASKTVSTRQTRVFAPHVAHALKRAASALMPTPNAGPGDTHILFVIELVHHRRSLPNLIRNSLKMESRKFIEKTTGLRSRIC
jgi:hypothetical protein